MLSQDLSAFWVRDLLSQRWYPLICPICFWAWVFYLFIYLITHSISWGVSQFMHCVEKYFITKVLNSSLLFHLTLLSFLNWKGWLAIVPCSPSPCNLAIILSPSLSAVSLTGRRVLSCFIINHIKVLMQSLVSLVSLLSTFPYAVLSFLTKDTFLTKGKTGTWGFVVNFRQYCR